MQPCMRIYTMCFSNPLVLVFHENPLMSLNVVTPSATKRNRGTIEHCWCMCLVQGGHTYMRLGPTKTINVMHCELCGNQYKILAVVQYACTLMTCILSYSICMTNLKWASKLRCYHPIHPRWNIWKERLDESLNWLPFCNAVLAYITT